MDENSLEFFIQEVVAFSETVLELHKEREAEKLPKFPNDGLDSTDVKKLALSLKNKNSEEK